MINISVIIPAYNAADTIGKTLGSLMGQNYNNWEAIVVDDGSQDHTAAVVRGLSEKDSRISIISQTNQGVSAARNAGIALARNEWLLLLDADDWISERYFEAFNRAAADFPDVDVFHCGWVRIAADGSLMLEKYAPDHKDLFPVLALSCVFAIHSCVFRKSLLEVAGVFDTSLTTCEDWDLWQRIARSGAEFKFVEKAMAYYSLRSGSLSKNAEQFHEDLLLVLKRGQVADARVSKPSEKYEEGIRSEYLPLTKIICTSWFIAHLIGEGKNFNSPLAGIENHPVPFVEPDDIADIIFENAILHSNQPLHYWPELWQHIGKNIKDFLSALENLTHTKGLARKSLLKLGRLIIQHGGSLDNIAIDPFYVVRIEITQPIADFHIPGAMERLYGMVQFEGEELGSIEIPIWEQQVPAWQVKDAIAKRFYWEILGLHYKKHIYSKGGLSDFEEGSKDFVEIHNQLGWTVFLRDIWGKPGWSVEQFYDPEYQDDSDRRGSAEGIDSDIEVTEDLADMIIPLGESVLPVKIGGSLIGTIKLPDANVLSAQQIRVLINTDLGLHLCQVSVREALVGKSSDQPVTLRHRFADISGGGTTRNLLVATKAPVSTLEKAISIRKEAGLYGSAIIDRAAVPERMFPAYSKMSAALGQIEAGDSKEQYQGETDIEAENQRGNNVISLYDRSHFETLFSVAPDPWKYTHAYEQTKYEQTLSLVPKGKINHAVEIACAEGHFTEQLAPKVKHLLAVDISKVALKRAAERCRDFSNIVFQHLDLFTDPITSKYDLIVCSEVLYFVGDHDKLKDIASKFSAALHPGGYLLTAHAHQIIDEPDKPGFDWGLPFGAKVIGEAIAGTGSLRLEKEIRTPLYRIQLFRKEGKSFFSRLWEKEPIIQILDQPTPVPASVESTVRWEGGEPSFPLYESEIYSDKLPVLMYHRIAPTGGESLSRFRVSPADLEDQLRYLKDCGFYSVKWEDWSQAMTMKKSLPGRPIALTFDDGYLDFYQYAWPLLKKYGFTATVFLVSDQIGTTNIWDAKYGEESPLMTWQQIKELSMEGVLFGSHACSHTALTGLSPTEVFEEGIESRTYLSTNLNYPVNLFAYPYGDTDGLVADLISSCGYHFGFTCEARFAGLKDNPMLLPRIEVKGTDTMQDFVRKTSLYS